MSDIIQLLPDSIANQIAAGEVIQRPASVVKELMENAIDAGATEITLIIKDAGKTLIQVIDNGKGMSEMDAKVAFERHATSKIKHAADLFNLATKGFRGEALASIAAIAHVELKTKEADAELGTKVEIEGSNTVCHEPCAAENGSSFAVKNLFFNVPARRNFLKSDAVEAKHILKEFQRIALVHPEISFEYINNDKTLYNLPKSTDRARIVDYFGKSFNQRLVPVNEETDIVKVSGFIVKPEFAKKQLGDQFFFVNNRYFKDQKLHHAVMKAFEDLVPSRSYPGYFIYLDVPAHTIDVNVHPTKTEIKFEDDRALYAILRSSIKQALGSHNIMPTLDFNADKNFDLPYEQKFKEVVPPSIQVDPEYNPFVSTERKPISSSSSSTSAMKPSKESWESFHSVSQQDTQQSSIIASNLETDEEVETLISEKESTGSKLFQIHKSYIVSHIKSGVLIIDQHRAHKRVLFEQYIDKLDSKSLAKQQLLFPEKLELSAEQIITTNELSNLLHESGFEFTTIKDGVQITAAPSSETNNSNTEELFKSLLDNLEHTDESDESAKTIVAKQLANANSITKNTILNEKEMQHLVDQLFACSNPTVSPEGNKIVHTMRLEDIQKLF